MAGAGPSARLGDRLTSILDLPQRLAALDGPAATRAARLLDVRIVEAATEPPEALEPWLGATFGSANAVRHQRIAKVACLATGDATLFALLRARRPVDGPSASSDLREEIASTLGDPFCHPESGTPAEALGRIRGARMVTGANAAAADAHHAVLVFDHHDPLSFDAELVADLLATGRAWANRTHAGDASASNYLLLWNCLWRAGGSITHGHAQALLGSGPHYARLERFRRDAAAYRAAHDADLAADLALLHADLDLALGDGPVTTYASLTPTKERELVIAGQPGMDERDPAFVAAVADALLGYRDRLGVRSFNLALWCPPLDGSAGWDGIPPSVRLIDRGDLRIRPSDIGAMELFGTPIVGSDPYDVVAALREA